MTLWSWSRTAATNASADTTINWAEGQAPSSVNDSARAMMAATSKYRDDISGAIVTGGTSTAYTVTSYEVFTTLALMDKAMVAFTPHTANGATVTLNVDGLGAKPLRTSTGVELLASTLIAGTPYVATYNNSDAVWYLQGFYGNPYNIPLGGMLPFIGATAPNSSFVFPYGQTISRTTYATLFTLVSTTYGIGDGSTTFTLPDFRGRVPAGHDAMGGSSASRLSSVFASTTLGGTGGVQNVSLAANQIPSLTSVNASQAVSVTSSVTNIVAGTVASALVGSGSPADVLQPSTGSAAARVSTGNNSISTTYTNSSQAVTNTVQPTIICNYILRII